MKKITIIKIGGNVIDKPEALAEFIKNFAKIEGPKVLIHGGGKIASEMSEKIGLEVQMHKGRRITDHDTLDVVTMVYAGLINKNIVASLQAANCNAIGMSGADGNTIPAKKRPATLDPIDEKLIDWGYVGDVSTSEVNTDLISVLVNAGIVPVFCALTHDQDGSMLNTNADTIASTIAIALAEEYAVKLVYCFEKNGVLMNPDDENSVIPHINKEIYADLLSKNIIKDGMIPKIENAFNALDSGVREVVIKNADNLLNKKESLIRLCDPKTNSAINLLKSIIEIPSISTEEENVSDFLVNYLHQRIREEGLEVKSANITNGIQMERVYNNILLHFGPAKDSKTLILCAHMDTVKPSGGYTRDPYSAEESDGKIYGLGSNDDGGSLVALVEAFFHLVKNREHSNLNLILALTTEEECSGKRGMKAVLNHLQWKLPDFAIIGEPTQMRAAIAERGLLVIDAIATGVAGHAARNEGENAMYKAIADINKMREYKFSKISPKMGEVKLSVTQINCGTQHNVVPDRAEFVIDIRPTDQYSNQEILDLLQSEVESELRPRNLKNHSSSTPEDSLLFDAVKNSDIESFVSPSTSDWICMGEIPAIKLGVGDSSRSHMPDEYITINDIKTGINGYIHFIETLEVTFKNSQSLKNKNINVDK